MFRNPLEERGARVCNARNTFLLKKFSLRTMCPQRAHALSPHIGGTSSAPTKGTKSKRAQKRADMLHHPCIPLHHPCKQMGIKSELAA